MTAAEIKTDYEANTGHVIIETFKHLDPAHYPAVLVAAHGPFTWGKSARQAVEHAVVLEFVARLAGGEPRVRVRPFALFQEAGQAGQQIRVGRSCHGVADRGSGLRIACRTQI